VDQPPSLSDDWWRSIGVCRVLCDWFSRHLVCLYLACDVRGQRKDLVYTGFLLRYQGLLLWVTAGHLIDEIKSIREDAACQIRQMRWLDACDIPHAESVIVHDRNLMLYSALSQGIDFGTAAIVGLDEANIVAAGRAVAMTQEIWRNIEAANPEGYYLIGYPARWQSAASYVESDSSVRHVVRAGLCCIPLCRVDGPPEGAVESSRLQGEAFYGRSLPFLEGDDYQPESIKGMSGGPVFSVERDPDGRVRYRLYGIQSTWWSQSRVIRAEPIERIAALIGGTDG
jgi:hypothetical protein